MIQERADPFETVEECAFPVDVKKYLLEKIVRFSGVPKYSFPNAADQHSISTE